MSQPSSGDPNVPYVKKPKVDAYTTMLILSLVFLITAITLLSLELNRYDWEWNVQLRTELPRVATLFENIG